MSDTEEYPKNSLKNTFTSISMGIKILIISIVIFMVVYVILTIVATIRRAANANANLVEAENLLNEAKQTFNSASDSFKNLDGTYVDLGTEYDKVYDAAGKISTGVVAINTAADSINASFESVAKTADEIDKAYGDTIDRYNELCKVAGLACIYVGKKEDGCPIEVQYYPYNSNGDDDVVKITPTYITPTGDSDRIYTERTDDKYVDSIKPDNGETQDINIKPVLRAYDVDGDNRTNGAAEVDTDTNYKKVTVSAVVIKNMYHIYGIDVQLGDSQITERFMIDEAVYNEFNGSDKTEYIYSVTDSTGLSENTIHRFEVKANGVSLRQTTTAEMTDIVKGNIRLPKKRPEVQEMRELHQTEFTNIGEEVLKVQNANKERGVVMDNIETAKTKIATSMEEKKEIDQARKNAVDTFEKLSVKDLVIERDLLDTVCTIM